MGKAKRKGPARRPTGGIVGQALKIAREADARRAAGGDPEAAAIADRVYATVIQSRNDVPYGTPLAFWAPALVAAEFAAPGIVKIHGLGDPADRALVEEVIAYLVSGMLAMVPEFNQGHFEQWRSGRLREIQEATSESGAGEGAGGGVEDRAEGAGADQTGDRGGPA